MTQSGLPLTSPDLLCGDDLDPFAGETTSDLQTLEQDVYHMLIEEPGSNPDDETRGIGLENYLSGNAADLAAATSAINTQLEKDPRIDQADTMISDATIGSPQQGVTRRVDITIAVNGAIVPLAYNYGANGLTVRA